MIIAILVFKIMETVFQFCSNGVFCIIFSSLTLFHLTCPGSLSGSMELVFLDRYTDFLAKNIYKHQLLKDYSRLQLFIEVWSFIELWSTFLILQ